jgi:TonB-linked SusC/RagA family outer membrane protein
MKKALLLLGMFCLSLLIGAAWAQQRTVTGKVVSEENGESLPGVNVVLKGTMVGSVTDLFGNYMINVPGTGGTLVFSFIGLESREVEIGNQSVINLRMKSDVRQLGEVVVTAVGIQRETKALGYSVEQIEGNKIQQVSEPDPLRALQGKIAGVNISGSSGAPGSATRITIRGNSSLLGNNQPLFIVDGIPFNNNTNRIFTGLGDGSAYGSRVGDIDPNNVQSITVLKGAAAAALYGSRAANGVVLITTKSGSATSSRKGLEVEYNGSYGIENIANLPAYQNIYGTGTNFGYQQVNGSWGAPFMGTRPYANTETISHWYSGRPGMGDFDGVRVPYRAYPDNVKNLFRTGSLIDNSISINGGGENTALSSTVSHTTHEGFVPNTEYQRTSLSVGGSASLSNGLYVNGNVTYLRSSQDAVQSGVGALGANNQSAFARALYLGRNWDIQGQPYQNPVDFGSEFMVGRGQADNPYWSYENAGYRSLTNRAIANVGLGYDIYDWLNVSYRVGINAYNQRQKDFIRPGSTGADGMGRITTFDVAHEEIESNFLVTFHKKVQNDFDLRAIVGHNLNQRTSDAQAFQGTEYVVFNIDDMDNVNSVVPWGGIYSRRRLLGVFGDVSVGYKDWAFLGLTGRNDWSSTLPIDNNSYFYPAVTGSLVASEALGISSNRLSNIKLRGAWSQVGNDTDSYQLVPVYLVNDYYSTSPAPTAQLPFTPTGGSTSAGASLSTTERDPNLKPERTTEYEFGVDLGFYNQRVIINATYYNRITKDQIAGVSLPAETGFTQLWTNFGEVQNKGIELALDLTPVVLPNSFKWNIFGVFTHNKNTVLSLEDGVDEITLSTGSFGAQFFSGGVSSVLRPGQEYGLLKGSVNARDQEGNLLIDPASGQMIRDTEPAIIGNPNPDFIMGITNSFSYKGFNLSAVFDWRQGGDLYANTVQTMLGRGVTKDTENREMNFIIPGVYGDPNTLEPIRTEGGAKIPNQKMIETNSLWFGETFAINAANEWSVYDATVFRLREITVGYDFPASVIGKSPFGRIRLSATGRNLWYYAPGFPKHTKYDPEVNQFQNSNVQGIEYSATPTTKRYSINLNLTF